MTKGQLVTPVLLAGGAGTRLWPLSRKSYPKQFVELVNGHSLFQECALRTTTAQNIVFNKPITVISSEYRFIAAEQLRSVGIEPGAILLEPSSKNTAPAILAATLFALKKNPEAVLLVSPSDHLITDLTTFQKTITDGLVAIKAGKLVTFGIQPTKPETAYGYMEVDIKKELKIFDIKRFVEKPTKEVAIEMISEGNYLWNSGIFLFHAKDMASAYKEYCPDIFDAATDALDRAEEDLDFLRLDPKSWDKCPDISIDYAIMEHSQNLVTVPFLGDWADLGGWDAVWAAQSQDQNGVAASENTTSIECSNVLLRSGVDGPHLVGLGLENTIAVATKDAVLVAKMDRTQDVKKVVEKLQKDKVSQATSSLKDHRPWGWFETLEIDARFQVKRIVVNPRSALSLQSHHHRSEHWIVVNGTAQVTIGEEVSLLTEGQSVYIPVGATHRLENPGLINMVLIEVQTGSYLGEDDIIRYDDIYSRA